MKPRVVKGAELVVILRGMAEAVEAGDSWEGSLEYVQPPHEAVPPEWDDLPDEAKAWYEKVTLSLPGVGGMEVYRIREDADLRDVFLLRGVYRIGNSMGQGGVRFLGRLD